MTVISLYCYLCKFQQCVLHLCGQTNFLCEEIKTLQLMGGKKLSTLMVFQRDVDMSKD